MIHGDPEDYFEGSGNFFIGGADFDTYSYTMPGGNSHGVNLNDAYVPVEGSDACSGGIITAGHLAGQSCAVGAPPPDNTPTYSTFSGSTTDFDNVADIEAVPNAVLEKPSGR